MACACSRVGLPDEVLLINESSGKINAAWLLTEEENDVFWTKLVACGCRLASDLTDSGAGEPIVVVQTLKNQSEKMAAPDVQKLCKSEHGMTWNLSRENQKAKVIFSRFKTFFIHSLFCRTVQTPSTGLAAANLFQHRARETPCQRKMMNQGQRPATALRLTLTHECSQSCRYR